MRLVLGPGEGVYLFCNSHCAVSEAHQWTVARPYRHPVEVPRVEYEKLAEKRNVEDSATVRKRVQAARERQRLRFKGTKLTCNAEMGPSEVREFCVVEPSAEKLLKAAMQQLHLSARAFHRVLKLARTIAGLAGCDAIGANHVAEAIQYRPRVGM